MDAGRCPGIFAERPTEWIGVSNPSAGKSEILQLRVHVHDSTIMQYLCIVHVYTSPGPVASLKLRLQLSTVPKGLTK